MKAFSIHSQPRPREFGTWGLFAPLEIFGAESGEVMARLGRWRKGMYYGRGMR